MVSTTKEFKISLQDAPGTLADLAATLGNAGINIEGLSEVSTSGGAGWVYFVTNNPDSTTSTLNSAGYTYSTDEVILTALANKPGTLASITRAFADQGINVTSFYITTNGTGVFGTDNVNAASSVVDQLGVGA